MAPTKRWSQRVTRESDALTLERRVFTKSPKAIAKSLKRSAERSRRRKSSPYRSAMSMLTFYINRAGRQLTRAQRARLEAYANPTLLSDWEVADRWLQLKDEEGRLRADLARLARRGPGS